MKELSKTLILGLSLAIAPLASALDILLISGPGVSADSMEAFLTDSECHTVTRELRRSGPGDASSYDLVIFTRNTASSEYFSNSAEWNAVTAPIILMNPYLFRNTHWGWITSTSTGGGESGDGFDAPYPDPDHSFLTGLTDPAETVFTSSIGSRRTTSAELLASGTTNVATGDAGARSAIFTIESGTVLSDPSATPAGNLRIAWPFNGLNDWDDVNSNGEKILRNMIYAATGSLPACRFLITDISFESGSGDLLLNFAPGGPNYTLKASHDLLSTFEEVESATLENGATFRVPAANLNPDKEFFLIEKKP